MQDYISRLIYALVMTMASINTAFSFIVLVLMYQLRLNHIARKLLFANTLTNFALGVSTVITTTVFQYTSHEEFDKSCVFRGFLYTFLYFALSMCQLCLSILVIINISRKRHKITARFPLFYTFPIIIGIPLILAVVPLCCHGYATTEPLAACTVEGNFYLDIVYNSSFYVLRFIIVVFIATAYCKLKRNPLSDHEEQQQAFYLMIYPIIFVILFLPYMIESTIEYFGDRSTVLYVIQFPCDNSVGVFDAISISYQLELFKHVKQRLWSRSQSSASKENHIAMTSSLTRSQPLLDSQDESSYTSKQSSDY